VDLRTSPPVLSKIISCTLTPMLQLPSKARSWNAESWWLGFLSLLLSIICRVLQNQMNLLRCVQCGHPDPRDADLLHRQWHYCSFFRNIRSVIHPSKRTFHFLLTQLLFNWHHMTTSHHRRPLSSYWYPSLKSRAFLRRAKTKPSRLLQLKQLVCPHVTWHDAFDINEVQRTTQTWRRS